MMNSLPWLNIILLTLCGVVCCVPDPNNYEHVIYIDPLHPNSTNDSSCYTNSKDQPCCDINFALAFPIKQSVLFILSTTSTHRLESNASSTTFADSSQLGFSHSSDDNGTAIVECMDRAGLAFVNFSQIDISGISFQYCGAWRNSTSKDFTVKYFKLAEIQVALYFYNCSDVSMVNMSVLNSTEAVGVVMYSTTGVNYIGNSQFEDNRISESNSRDSGGGGFAVEFNYCIPGDDTCNETNHQTENNQNASYTFENCSFSYNRGVDQSGANKTGISILPKNETHTSLGRGGGLSVFFEADALGNNIEVRDCLFLHNHANWGGGLCIQFADHSINNNVTVSDTHFETNHCYYNHEETGATGGGALVSSVVHYDERTSYPGNSMLFTGCTFEENRALTGGALAFVYALQRHSHHFQHFNATVSNSTFTSNYARLGSAVAIDHEYFYHQGELGQVLMSDCNFYDNKIVYSNTSVATSVGVGTVYISEIRAIFEGDMTFEGNNGSALALVSTRITFSENSIVNFTANNGTDGGAIGLLGGSSILVGQNTILYFDDNRASGFGGAIFNVYVGKEDLRSSVKCFLLYDDPFIGPNQWMAKFIFKNNKAGKLGKSIYSTTILPCSWSEDLQAKTDITRNIFCWNESIWIYEDSNCTDEIYTAPQEFTGIDLTIEQANVYPGNPFRLNITALDDLGHDVTTYTIYTALVKSEAGTTAVVDPAYAYVANGSLSLTGLENRSVTLQLDVVGNRDWRLELPLKMKTCPLGYLANTAFTNISKNNSSLAAETKCECIGGPEVTVSFGGNLICVKANFTSDIRNGYWFGKVPKISNSSYVMGSTNMLLQDISSNFIPLNDSQCSHLNRKGPLCGECIENYSTAVNSYNYECVPCTSDTTNLSLNIFLYILLTYLPYLIVFIVILYFDIRLMSGPLIGFILYAQLIGSGVFDLIIGRLPYGDAPAKLQKAYRLMYGVFNLNSFATVMDPFCINEHFSALDVICLDYAVAAFPLVLILIIHLAMRLKASIKLSCKKRNRANHGDYSTLPATSTHTETENTQQNSQRSLIHSLVGFILLSYTKFSVASTLLLTTTGVFNEDGSYIISPRLLYYAGQYYFGERDYILYYGLWAILLFIFISIFLPILLLGPLDLINWLLDSDKPAAEKIKRCYPTIRINTFLQAFQSAYRFRSTDKKLPERRYFAGVYFVFRLIMLIVFAFSSDSLSQALWQALFVILMIILLAVFQPYKVKFYNFLDMMMFFNMAGIALLGIYLYTTPSWSLNGNYPFASYIAGSILVWLPMVYLGLYLALYLCQCCFHKKEWYNNMLKRFDSLYENLSAHFANEGFESRSHTRTTHPLAQNQLDLQDDRDSLGDSMLLERAEGDNLYKKSKSSVMTTVVGVGYGTSGSAQVHLERN